VLRDALQNYKNAKILIFAKHCPEPSKEANQAPYCIAEQSAEGGTMN